MLVNPFGLASWGATDAEVAGDMVGDDQVPDAMFSATRSISVQASPDKVFPWLRQMGYKRGGWYSYDWVDNLGKESARTILPEWQDLQVGDPIPAGPMSFTATTVEPDRAFCMLQTSRWVQFSLAFELRPTGADTRLVSRARARIALPGGRLFARWFLEPGDGVMVRRQLLGIKERAEALA